MAKENNGPLQPPVQNNAVQNVVTPVLAGLAANGGGKNDEVVKQLLEFLSVNKAITDIQYEEMLKQREVNEERLKRDRILAAEKVAAAEEEARMKEIEQLNCGHRKENGGTLVRGNMPPNRKLHCICLRCAKIWIMDDTGVLRDNKGRPLDGSLHPNDDQIGGLK